MTNFTLTGATSFSPSLLASADDQAASFSFTKIADTTNFSSVSSPSVNDSGTVAFRANNDDLNSVFIGDGGELTDIYTTTIRINEPRGPSGSPAISNTGTVAFYSNTGLPRGAGVFVGSAEEPVTQIASFDYVGGPGLSINNSGTVAFKSASNLSASIDANNAGRTTSLVSYYRPSASSDPLSDASINNAGTVAFSGTILLGSLQEFEQGIFTINSSGRELTPVLLQSSTFSGFKNPSINDQGTIAFSGQNNGVAGMFTIDSNGSLSTITDASDQFKSFGNLSLNNQGTVAFVAGLNTGASGIFFGPDPVTDKVIATGDSLFDSTVTNVGFFPGGLNNSGEVAFFAQLADGSTGIFRADPQSGRDNSGQGAFFDQLTNGTTGSLYANPVSFPPTHSVY